MYYSKDDQPISLGPGAAEIEEDKVFLHPPKGQDTTYQGKSGEIEIRPRNPG